MRVCIIGAHLPPVMGGIENHIWELASGLAEAGDDISVIGHLEPGQEKIFKNTRAEKGFKVFREGRNLFMRRPSRALNKVSRVLSENRRNRFDIIHAHQVIPEGTLGGFISGTLKTPLVITAHGAILNDASSLFKRPFLKLGFSRAYAVIAASSELGERCVKGGAEKEKVRVFPNAVDTGAFCPGLSGRAVRERYGIGPGEIVVLSLRRITPKTGIQYLVRAAPRILEKERNIRFIIAGESPAGEPDLRARLIRETEDAGVSERFIFPGTLQQKEVPEYIAACDFALFPSLAEATSIAALEVMASGKPVIASRVGGLPEIITDGYNGILVDFDRADSSYRDYGLSEEAVKRLISAVLLLAGSPEKRKSLGENAAGVVRREFSWKRYIEKIRALYREAAAHKFT